MPLLRTAPTSGSPADWPARWPLALVADGHLPLVFRSGVVPLKAGFGLLAQAPPAIVSTTSSRTTCQSPNCPSAAQHLAEPEPLACRRAEASAGGIDTEPSLCICQLHSRRTRGELPNALHALAVASKHRPINSAA